MSAYQDECAKACEWCANGMPMDDIVPRNHIEMLAPSKHSVSAISHPCTAPTPLAVIDRLTADLDRRRKDREDDKQIISGLQEHVTALQTALTFNHAVHTRDMTSLRTSLYNEQALRQDAERRLKEATTNTNVNTQNQTQA